MNKQIETKVGLAIILLAAAGFLLITFIALKPRTENEFFYSAKTNKNSGISGKEVISELTGGGPSKLSKFTSEEDFKDYLEKSQKAGGSSWGFGRGGGFAMPSNVPMTAEKSIGMLADSSAATVGAPLPDRVSDTNVQVLGIDEPDIVKTDGKQIYFSQPQNFIRPLGVRRSVSGASDAKIGIVPPPYPYPIPEETGKTKIIKAFPFEDLKISSEIDKNGDLLLYQDVLIVFAEDKHKIYGFDVSQPENPREKWSVELNENDELVGARLDRDKIYLATRSFIKPDRPCPIEPFIIGGDSLKLECDQIYHPDQTIPVDLTYNLLSFDASTGKAEKSTSFVGSSSDSVFYMSEQAIYLTYNYPGNFIKLFSDFLGLNSDLVPSSITEKIRKVQDYDLSDAAKQTELENILSHFTRSLSSDEMMRIQNELTNRVEEYTKKHNRELENTGIVKIGIPNLEVAATGRVPGKPLNQFSLDEYQNNLRLATTFSGNFGWIGGIIRGGGNNNRASDVYVLNNNLDEIGSVKDLGKGERIYSVRFLEDKGYVVTFKQVDPFFVLDLSSPKNPSLRGQLKIPGYSSYLHPLENNIILGVGEEDGQVKITLFDVRSPDDPEELGTYRLDEYWSEVSTTHHAFLQDKKHQVFFLPGSKGAYVFSYKDNELKLVKTVSESGTRRALYINDYLFMISDNKISVLDENGWEKIKELEL